MSNPVTHLWQTDGTIACKGLDLAGAAARRLYTTIYEEDTTCEVCLGQIRKRRVQA